MEQACHAGARHIQEASLDARTSAAEADAGALDTGPCHELSGADKASKEGGMLGSTPQLRDL
jgi:hypothetical protein